MLLEAYKRIKVPKGRWWCDQHHDGEEGRLSGDDGVDVNDDDGDDDDGAGNDADDNDDAGDDISDSCTADALAVYCRCQHCSCWSRRCLCHFLH